MDDSKYDRSVAMKCDTCGQTEFSFEEPVTDTTKFTCTNCERTYLRAELIELNQPAIDGEVEAIGKEVVDDLAKDLRKSFGKSFRK